MHDAGDLAGAVPGSARTGGVVNAVGFLVIFLLGLLAYLTPLDDWLAQGQALKAELAGFGPVAPAVFTVLAALLTAVGAPRLLLCSLGGLAFGFAWGLLWSLLATLLGSYGVFLFVRRFGGRYELKNFRRLNRLSGHIENNAILSVLLIRQLPMSGFYNNVFLGLAGVGHRPFLVGSLLGFLPLGITACLIGAGLLQADFAKATEYLALALFSSVVLGWGLKSLQNMAAARNRAISAEANQESC
jgi:uncharacterized membrane protein YdjX (TVP38/TMEM64 family)